MRLDEYETGDILAIEHPIAFDVGSDEIEIILLIYYAEVFKEWNSIINLN